MKDFHFKVPMNVYFGKNAMENMPAEIKPHTNKVMLVYGGGSIKRNGAYDQIISVLNNAGIEYVDFGGNTNPWYSNVLKGVELARKENVGCVIGIGGSTCMDMAKIIAVGVKHDNLWEKLTSDPYTADQPRLLVGAIPTFPSGGSEAGFGAEVDDEKTGKHGSLYAFAPDFSILNPEFSFTLDPLATAYGAMVTFIQVSLNHLGGEFALTERITEAILDVIRESAETAIKEPENYEARANQMYASTFGTNGIPAKGKEIGWSYEMYDYSGVMRKLMGLAYRQGFTVIFPSWLKAEAKYHGEEVKKYLVRVWGVDDSLPTAEACEKGVQIIKDYFVSLGIPMKYNAYGPLPTDEEMIAAVEREGMYNPMPMDEILAMFKDAMDL